MLTMARGLPPIAAMSFTFTRTEQYPAQYGSFLTRSSRMPSAARRSSFFPDLMTAASSP